MRFLVELTSGNKVVKEWFDVEDFESKLDFEDKINEMLEDCEYRFEDWVDIPEGLIETNYVDEFLWELDDIESQLNGGDLDTFIEFCDEWGLHLSDAWNNLDSYNDMYMGNYGSMRSFAEEHIDELYEYNIPSSWIDYDQVERDLSNDYTEINGHIFANS